MFRLTQYMEELNGKPVRKRGKPAGPVVIWNLTRRCNLRCKHCYTVSADKAYPGELTTPQIFNTISDLKDAKVPVLILSGGEPLLHPDIFEISERARELGFFVALSTNGTQITDDNIDRIAAMEYDYVGISIDGKRALHNQFRGREGAYDGALSGVRRCLNKGIRVGLRYTLTELNQDDFPAMLDLVRIEGIQKFYLSHLNYGGRGNINRESDAYFETTRKALTLLFETAWQDAQDKADREYVTGNNDADGPYLLQWVNKNLPEHYDSLQSSLEAWGGNASGINVANIDNLGNVHPDTFWWDTTIGNVLEKPFTEIWNNPDDELLNGLKAHPRRLEGRCADCRYLKICNGNSRVRAKNITGNVWAEDPGCYLTDAEIGLESPDQRIDVTPFEPKNDTVAAEFAEHLSGRP